MPYDYNPATTTVATHSDRITAAVNELVTLINDAAAQEWLATPEGQEALDHARWAIEAAIMNTDPSEVAMLDSMADEYEHRRGVGYDLTDWEDVA